MNFPVLYKKSKKDVLQQWQIFISNNSYWTEAGQVGGVITKSLPTEVFGKNLHKANATSDKEQTLKEVLAIITKQKEKGYNEEVKDAGKVDYFKPMLAKEYNKYKDKLVFPVYSQPKLDGVRCLATKDGLFSRSGKAIVACPHIFDSVKHLFKQNPSLVLDGELYQHSLSQNFDKLISLIRKTKPDADELIESKNHIEYWVYDCPSKDLFSSRLKFIENLKNKHVVIVESKLCNNPQDIDRIYEEYLEQDFEGQMIRKNASYENCRSEVLLKRKEFSEAEFKIIDVLEGVGNWKDVAGTVVLLNSGGQQFRATPKMTYELKKELLVNKKAVIGELGTVRFQNYTPDLMVPRFPRFICVRNYE